MPKSEGMSAATKAVLAGVAAGAVIGGAYVFLKGSSASTAEKEDDAFGQPAPAELKEPSGGMKESRSDSTLAKGASTYSFAVNSANAEVMEEHHKIGERQEVAKTIDNAKHYERLGLLVPLPKGWQCKEEAAPVPSISMISLTKPEFELMQSANPMDFGRAPIVLISVEDLSIEGLNGEEYMAKSKGLAFQQMMMMTQGMYQPKLEHEGPLSVGPFNLCLEYSQITPQISMKVMNLIQVENGLAYVLQMMCRPEVFDEYRSEFMTIARDIQLFPTPVPTTFIANAYLETCTGSYQVKVPSCWKVNNTSAAIASFNSGSQQKTDSISIYTNDDDSVIQILSSGKEISESKKGNVTITTLQDNSSLRHKKLFTNGNFALVIQPIKAKTVTVPDAYCVEVLESIVASTEEKGIRYVTPARNFAFTYASNKGSLLETRVGDGAILYAPEGLEQDIMLTIRVEDPTTDPDCMPSLDAWESRIRSEAEASNLTEIHRQKAGGKDALTFVTKEMVEVGPGMKEERVAKVVIFLNQDQTHMLRWEAGTANFRRTERQLNALLESYTLI